MKTIHLIIVLFAFLQLHTATAQENICSIEYKHMSGDIDGQEAILDLHLYNNEITGTCILPGIKKNDSTNTHMRMILRLEGRIDRHNVATIRAYSEGMEAGTFSGLIGKTFSGTFRQKSAGTSKTFRFSENPESGAIPLIGYCMKKDSSLLDTIDRPFAHLELSLLLPPDQPLYSDIRDRIIKAFMGKLPEKEIAGDRLLNSFGMEYFSRYINNNKDIYDGGASFHWEMTSKCWIELNYSGLLVYRIDSYGYSGGAHGMGISRFLVFDTEKMHQLDLDDIFTLHYKEALGTLLEAKYREMHYLDKDQTLTDAGLFENHIPPANNFFITVNGIGFFYNPYKIAPFAMGSQVISLGWHELAPLIKDDSSVRMLFGQL